MRNIYDVPANDLIEQTAEDLKKIIKAPEWSIFVKTGTHRERQPLRDDWWYIRAASVLRTVLKLGPIGVSKLRTKYGGRKNRGHKPDATRRAGGKILRTILQQLEKSTLVKQTTIGVHKGRIITKQGKELLDNAAKLILKHQPKKEEPKSQKPKVSEGLETKPQSVEEKPKEEKKAEVKQEKPKVEEKPVEKPKEEKKVEPKSQKPKASKGLETKPQSPEVKKQVKEEPKKTE